jgi:adenylate cyclase
LLKNKSKKSTKSISDFAGIKSRKTPPIRHERPSSILIAERNFKVSIRKKMAQATQIKLRQLGTIIAAWTIIALFITVYDHLVLLTTNSTGLSSDYSLLTSAAQHITSALVGGILGGSLLVFYINVRYNEKPYWQMLLTLMFCFLLVIAIIIVIKALLFTNLNIAGSFNRFLADSSRIKNVLAWFVVVALTQLLLQINGKVGQHGLRNILGGTYHMPQEENRIFMFLDLNNSTAIAEMLGDEKYHSLLRDFFSDLNDPILNNHGEVYQYVGDEVIIAWKYSDGIINNRCVNAYFDIQRSIENHRPKYLHKYGMVPEFRAAIHSGKVVAGEVGGLKRELTYSGDVLNTTSRILGKSKEIGAGIIASASLLKDLTIGKDLIVRNIGPMKLKGKEREVNLNEILYTGHAA